MHSNLLKKATSQTSAPFITTSTAREEVITFSDALVEGMDLCLQKHANCFLIGEGVADPKAIFGTTKGLFEKYGPDRIIEMPVAENGLTGVVIGAAMSGMRPVMTHQRVDFSLLSLEQIFNNAAKMHYLSNGQHQVPIVIRMIIGRGWGQGPQHSQSLESIFGHIPGLKVYMPSRPQDAKSMLMAAVEDNSPVVFIEHRWLHYNHGPVEQGYSTLDYEGPRVALTGKDATIVATSWEVIEALRAGEFLKEIDIHPEVIDLRVIRPLKMEKIIASVVKTNKLITVDTGWSTYGIGAEIIASVMENNFTALNAKPIRLGALAHPTPSSRSLIKDYYPTASNIAKRVASMLKVSEAKLNILDKVISEKTKDDIIDVPVASFRGPF